ncbi:T-cell surface glycoprotein CD3 epsilon chain-like [Danio aesculapii]|uniref:T-cell surface glycoprotein CD3 epsilon chain-like n=1 Tax=Danio aesculapii TaxID=1142201 RepID=UPI0024C099FD|nr:T-cell surface glycoprotein CD3 epsilon chain-like [Danio aesculapii]
MRVWIITALMLTATAANAQDVYFTSDGAVLSCPGAVSEWDEKQNKNQSLTIKADQGTVKGTHRCKYEEDTKEHTHVFYIDAKVCKGCVEFNGWLATAVIFGDLLLTGGLILIIYLCTTKNSTHTQQKASTPRSANPPRPPNPDYEKLNTQTLSSGLYAGINKT